MIKDELKYSTKIAKFGVHFVESVERLRGVNTLDNIYPIIRWLRFAEQKWELAIHYLHALSQTIKYEPPINLFQLRDLIIGKNLDSCYLTQPPINGDVLLKRGIKGPAISRTLENATIWRITNQNKSVEQFLKELQENAQFFMSGDSYR